MNTQKLFAGSSSLDFSVCRELNLTKTRIKFHCQKSPWKFSPQSNGETPSKDEI